MEGLVEKLGVKLGVNQMKIIEIMRRNNQITIVKMQKELGISMTAIENNIKKLKLKDVVERKGSDKGGYWVVKV